VFVVVVIMATVLGIVTTVLIMAITLFVIMTTVLIMAVTVVVTTWTPNQSYCNNQHQNH